MKMKNRIKYKFKKAIKKFPYHLLSFVKFIWFLMFIASLVFTFFIVRSYMKEPGQYDASNYENLGAHTFEFREVQSYKSGSRGRRTRYKINYETTINGEYFVYTKDDYRTKDAAMAVVYEKPMQTKYVYRINSKGKITVRFSDMSTAEEVASRALEGDRKIIELAIPLFIVCIIILIGYRIIKHKSKVKSSSNDCMK